MGTGPDEFELRRRVHDLRLVVPAFADEIRPLLEVLVVVLVLEVELVLNVKPEVRRLRRRKDDDLIGLGQGSRETVGASR